MSNTKQLCTVMPELPCHIILDEILPRLPVKSLLQFKSVCKTWRTFISSNEFATSHLRYSSRAPGFFMINSYSRVFHSIRFDEDDVFKDELKIKYSFDKELGPVPEIAGSCNGLVCMLGMNDVNFVIWNQATRTRRVIRVPFERQCVTYYGLGYESKSDDYKIIAGYTAGDPEDNNVFIYSFRTGGWTSIRGCDDIINFRGVETRRGVYVNDNLYWVVHSSDKSYDTCLIEFNLVHQRFTKVGDVNWVNKYVSVELDVVKGYITLCCCKFDYGGVDVWVMRSGRSFSRLWEKVFSIPSESSYNSDMSGTYQCFIQYDGLKLADPQNKDVEKYFVRRLNRGFVATNEIANYVESLVSPFWNSENSTS